MRDLTGDELREQLSDLKEELFNLRFQAVTGQLPNPARVRLIRKDIARVMTVMRERELGIKRM
jgi:large subunit ribosomal protein L29